MADIVRLGTLTTDSGMLVGGHRVADANMVRDRRANISQFCRGKWSELERNFKEGEGTLFTIVYTCPLSPSHLTWVWFVTSGFRTASCSHSMSTPQDDEQSTVKQRFKRNFSRVLLLPRKHRASSTSRYSESPARPTTTATDVPSTSVSRPLPISPAQGTSCVDVIVN